MKRWILFVLIPIAIFSAVSAHSGEFDGLWRIQDIPDALYMIRHDEQTILAVELDLSGSWSAYLGPMSGSSGNVQTLFNDLPLNANLTFTSLSTGLIQIVSCSNPVPGECPPPGATFNLVKLF